MKQFCLLSESQREKIDNFIERCIKENIFSNEVEGLRVITPFYCNETLTEQHFELPKEQLLEIFGDSINVVRNKIKEEEHFNFDKRNKSIVENVQVKMGGLF